jgi:hypothetical protein
VILDPGAALEHLPVGGRQRVYPISQSTKFPVWEKAHWVFRRPDVRTDDGAHPLQGVPPPCRTSRAERPGTPERPSLTKDGFETGGTNQQHKTHKTEIREVHYRWHALYRQEIPVRLERGWKSGLIARCDPHSDVGLRGFGIPAWMLDRTACANMKLSPVPVVDTEALTELRHLLDCTLGKEEPGVVEGGHRLDAGQGGAYAQGVTPTRAIGVVSPLLEDPRVEDAPRDSPKPGVRRSDTDVPGSMGANRGGSGTGRIEG